MTAPKIVLASKSAIRRQVLTAAGLDYATAGSDVDEAVIKNGFDGVPEDLALALALEKARAVSKSYPGALVIGADQLLDCEGRLFDKPEDLTGAARNLAALQGREHRLVGAACVVEDGETVWTHVAVSRLKMRALSDAAIAAYLERAGEKVCESVGAYQLEGLGAALFEEIDGDYFAILGLALLPLLAFLRTRGIDPIA